jgi:8-amino-7-oxononanoate synthase
VEYRLSLPAATAIVLCTPLVRSYLINYARPLIYTTFMPFPSLAAIKASYSLLQSGATEPVSPSLFGAELSAHLSQLVDHLSLITRHLHTQLLRILSRNYQQTNTNMEEILHIDAACPTSPIFALLTQHPRSLAQHCQDAGFVVRAVVPPTVPTRRVRVCLHAGNTIDEVNSLVRRIESWVRDQLGIGSVSENRIEAVKARLYVVKF